MKNIVYLAGGMRSGWQNIVKSNNLNVSFIDPCEKEKNGKPTLQGYSVWDLHGIKKSDIVFVYIERGNPGIIGCAVEAGYAKGLGKTVILVQEIGNETIDDRYINFIQSVADITFHTLYDGIKYLKIF